jgi:hypothetical protein
MVYFFKTQFVAERVFVNVSRELVTPVCITLEWFPVAFDSLTGDA